MKCLNICKTILWTSFSNINIMKYNRYYCLTTFCLNKSYNSIGTEYVDDYDIIYNLHDPGENFKSKNYVSTSNTTALLKIHLLQTNNQVQTRFPPEPNGLLHIGHAKAMNISFGYAKNKNGICYLRFDDTNPETEQKEFSKNILEVVKWLGFEPFKVTYASDYFSQMHSFAKQLIEKNLAYVCHEPQMIRKLSEYKDKDNFSPWRYRPINDSLHTFEEMTNRKYKEGEAVLRLKHYVPEISTVDPVIYRIKYEPHSRTKTEWCVYPTYDFAQALSDSLQNITHSLCTSEFAQRRPLYYWICNAADVYCPVQTEFGRLNLLYTVVSKRKILELIKNGHVKNWDDPRLYTLAGLKRRGVPPEAILNFCKPLGLNPVNIYADPEHFNFHVRRHLEVTAFRRMAVLDPLRVVITNFPSLDPILRPVLNLPDDETRGRRQISFDKDVWIEATDFKQTDEKGYRRLTPTQSVGLKHSGHVIMLEKVVRKLDGSIDHLLARCFPRGEAPKKPKAFVHWVSKPKKAEFRLYDKLFLHERPEKVPGGFLCDVNPNSLTVVTGLIEGGIEEDLDIYSRLQFERIGYFSVDPDSTKDNVVFNKIVDLKQLKGFKS